VVRQSRSLRESAEDLHACHRRLKKHRIDAAAAQAAPLHDAIRKGDRLTMQALLQQGADCNALVIGFAALHVAIQSGRFDFVECLLHHGADPTVQSAISKETPVLLASCEQGDLKSSPERLQALLAMVEAIPFGVARTAAFAASAGGSTPLLHVCRRLVETEAGIFSGDSFARELDLAQLFLRSGADAHAKNVFGMSPLLLLQQLSSKADVFRTLDLSLAEGDAAI